MTPLYAIYDVTHLGPALELAQSGTVLTVDAVADINHTALAIQPQTIGRWYAEMMCWGPGTLTASIGIATPAASLSTYVGGDANGYGYRLDLGQIHTAGASVASVAVGAKGDIIGVLLDLTTTQPTVTWYRNGALLHTQELPSTGPWALAASIAGSEPYGLRCFLNAGQRAFEYPIAGVDGWYEPPQEIGGLRIASEDWLSDPADAVPNDRYKGVMAGDNSELRAVRSLDFWPWQRGIKTGAMVLSVLDDGSFSELLSGDARDMTVRVSQIDAGDTYADRAPLYSAVIDSVSAVDDLSVKLTCRDPLGLLDVPVQRMLIRPSADPAAANTPRPIVLGACRNIPAVLLDAGIYSYAVCDAPLLGIGYVRDSGYPLNPAAVPPDFVLSASKLGIHMHAEPTGKITIDASSVGGDQLPQPSDDILGGAGDPFTGADGSPPDGFASAGGDVPQASPALSAGLLQFPLVQVSPTIYVALPIYTSGVVGSVAVRITWLADDGHVVGTTEGPRVSGTQAWAISEVIDTAPADAVNGRIEAASYDHTAGVIRVGVPSASYVKYGDHTAIGLQNPTFDDALNGWTADGPGWVQETSSSVDGKNVPGTVAYFHGSGISGLTNNGIAPSITAGQRITAYCKAALYTQGGGRPGAELLLLWYDASDNMISFARSGALTKGNRGRYSVLSCTGTAPAGVSYARLKLSANNPSGSPNSGPRFDAASWTFALEPSSGERLPIALGDYSDATRWHLGVGWSLQPAGPNGYLGDAYAEHAAGAPGTSVLTSNRPANVRQAVAYAGWLGIGAAKFGAGKSYQVTVTITDMPDDGQSYVGLATGTTLDTMIVSWKKPGTYTVAITNTDGVDHPLYLLAVPFSAGAGTVPVPPTIGSIKIIEYDDTYTPDPISLEPALLQGITLADYMHQVLDVRGQQLGVMWSDIDAAAIDTATGYAGVGVYLAGAETVAQALDMALASYTACKWCDASGTVRISRMVAPESVAAVGTIDINAMSGDLVPALDTAPALTTQMGVRRNWAQLSDGDLVEPSLNFPLAVRQTMLRQYQQTASSAQQLAGAYRHALYAPPVASCFDQLADGQAEIDRVCAIYTVPRWFYAVTVELDALLGLDLGQVWTLVYPKYGLAAGKRVMVIDYEPDLLAGTANIILWG